MTSGTADNKMHDEQKQMREERLAAFRSAFLSLYARTPDSPGLDTIIGYGIDAGAFRSHKQAKRLLATARKRADRADRKNPYLSPAEAAKAEIDNLVNRYHGVQSALSLIGPVLSAALEKGVWPTQAQAAVAVGISRTDVQAAIAISRLPKQIRDCFAAGQLGTSELKHIRELARRHGWHGLEENASRFPSNGRKRSIRTVMRILATGKVERD